MNKKEALELEYKLYDIIIKEMKKFFSDNNVEEEDILKTFLLLYCYQ